MPDEQRYPVYLTGEQLSHLRYILRQERNEAVKFSHSRSEWRDDMLRTVEETYNQSDHLAKTRERVNRNLERWRRHRHE